ncbi:MAG: 30S ribosomal protein S9 [Candidatus Kerfeldbacteria bacterium]|nr:30S ribosomal protein S9 [Candidatus Kerfeldbacteria bacterium]
MSRPKPIHRTYTFAVGRRKSAVARVRFIPKGTGQFMVNGREVKSYFPSFELQKIVHDALELTKFGSGADLSIKVSGGGTHGQAEAVRLGISRVFVKLQPDLRSTLKRAGFLRRDPRVKERKKYGLKRARRAPQWQKR